jgi:peptidoglycan/LPS O-acetylase OafA/YrhL
VGGSFSGLLLLAILEAPSPKDCWPYDLLAIGIVFPALILLGSLWESPKLLNDIWLWLGELSYPLYITHQPFVRLIKNAMTMLHLDGNPILTFSLCVVASVIAAAVFLVV